MVDYLKPVGRAWRIISIVGCTLTSFVFVLLSLWACIDMLRRHSLEYNGSPMWPSVAVAGLVGIMAGFMAWRLARGQTAANGVTAMPTWFIQLCGVLLLVVFSFMAYEGGSDFLLLDGVAACLAMILVGRKIAKRKS